MLRVLTASKCVVTLQILVIILSASKLPPNAAFSSSPSFPIQAIEDNLNDWSLMATSPLSTEKNITNCADAQNRIPYADIAAISYTSDGKVLNTTLWLSSPFEEPSSNFSSPFTEIQRRYVMLIVTGSVYDTVQRYLFTVNWEPGNRTWFRTIEQLSPSAGENNVFDKWEKKILSHNDNYSGFFNLEENHVDLNLNLNTINLPPQYSVVSYVSQIYIIKNYQKFGICHIQDITDIAHFPPPEFSMTISPGSLTLRPGEEKRAELQIKNNNPHVNSLVDVYTSGSKGIELNFTPNRTYVPQDGMATLLLDIKASEDVPESPHTIPIFANITFPTSLRNLISGEEMVNPESASVLAQSNFTVTVLPPLQFDDYLNRFYNSWLAPISGIVGLAAVIAPLFIYIYRKKQRNIVEPKQESV